MSVNYGYDVKGQRISLREQTGSSITSTNFPTSAYSETTRPDGTVERTVSIEAVGLPIATIRTRNTDAPEIYITHTDHLRSTRLVTTEGAGLGNVNIVEQTDYDPFGKITRHEQTGDFAEKKKFTSHEFDAATSYTYAKARYLETNIGRFISQDKAFLELGSSNLSNTFRQSAFAGDYISQRLRGSEDERAALEAILKDPQALNSYAYARNNPVKFVDETGELPVLAAAGIIFIGGAVSAYVGDVLSNYAAGASLRSFIPQGSLVSNLKEYAVAGSMAVAAASVLFAASTVGVPLAIGGAAVVAGGGSVLGDYLGDEPISKSQAFISAGATALSGGLLAPFSKTIVQTTGVAVAQGEGVQLGLQTTLQSLYIILQTLQQMVNQQNQNTPPPPP